MSPLRLLGALSLALLPGCLLPTPFGVEVVSLTHLTWSAVARTTDEPMTLQVEGDDAVPRAFLDVRPLYDGQGARVVAEWSDGSVRLHEGTAPILSRSEAILSDESRFATDEQLGESDAPRRATWTLTAPAGTLLPGDVLLFDGSRHLVVRRAAESWPAVELGPRTEVVGGDSPGFTALCATGAVVATPATAAVDVVLFVLGLPIFAVMALLA